MANTSAEMIYVIYGPELHGQTTYAALATVCSETAARFGWKAECRPIDDEAKLIDSIREAEAEARGIVIDAGRSLNTSIALRAALSTIRIPVVEVHASEHRADESFRHHRFAAKPPSDKAPSDKPPSDKAPLAAAPLATLSGFGIDGYRLAILGLAAGTGVKAPA